MKISDNQETKKYPKGISSYIPPPGFNPRASVIRTQATSLHASLFSLMTSDVDVVHFKEMISTLDKTHLQRIASLLTSDSDYFTAIIGNSYGSVRVQRLLGKSDDVDGYVFAAILRSFLNIMTHKYASYVAVRAMVVFEQEKKRALYELTLHYALDIACDQYGCAILNEVITDLDDLYYRNKLLDLISCNALFLSNDVYGNFVVQHVLRLNDLRCTVNVAVSLSGCCVDLSFKKYGSFIVERLLEGKEESVFVVVTELLECEGGRLVRLARSEFGSYVVVKALRVTREKYMVDLFWGLVHKLMPFLNLLRKSRAVAAILESTV